MGFEQIFQDPFAFVVAIGSIVAFLRKHFLKNVDGKAVIVLSAVVGAGLGVLGAYLGYYDMADGVLFGVIGGLLTSGLVDFVRGLLKVIGDFLPDETRKKIEEFLKEYEEKEGKPAEATAQANRGKTKLM